MGDAQTMPPQSQERQPGSEKEMQPAAGVRAALPWLGPARGQGGYRYGR